MDVLKLHKLVGFTCLGLSPIGPILGGLEASDSQSKIGTEILFFLVGIYLPFYALKCFHIGQIESPGSTHVIYKDKDRFLFWVYILMLMGLSIAFLSTPFR